MDQGMSQKRNKKIHWDKWKYNIPKLCNVVKVVLLILGKFIVVNDYTKK